MKALILRTLVLVVLFANIAFAQTNYKPIDGAIPLQYGGFPATDLMLDGQHLSPQEAHEYYLDKNKATRGNWTLAELQPENNDVWSHKPITPYDAELDNLPLKNQLDDVSFVSYSATRSDNYRFTVAKDHSFYQTYMGPKVHNFLLRKNLLRKLGYTVPAVKYLKSLRVDFKSVADRNDFLLDFGATVSRDTDRWITSAPEGESYFYAQDLIIMEDTNTIPNLSTGFVADSIIDGKRIYNSLILPYSLTDAPESINMMSWAQGRILSENVILPYEHADSFTCSSDDAVWMARKILALTENDWLEIAENSHLPEPVAVLMFEKLKSRRNHLASLFRVQTKKFKIDTEYTDQDGIVKDGKLTQQFFEGYGRYFKIPDPESPLSWGEMSSLLKSKVVSVGLDLLVNAFNSQKFMSTQLDDKIKAINDDISIKAADAVKEGKPINGFVKGYVYPTVSGRVIVGRDIVAGSYLGTDNLIQLVDTVGFSVSAGAYAGVAGIFSKTGVYAPSIAGAGYEPVSVSGSGNLSYSRNYAHVKPIQSVKKALKYPFKNIIIPLLKKKQAKIFDEQSEKDFDKINALVAAEQDKEYEQIFNAINTEMEIGESVIITDSISLGVSADVGASLYGIVNAKARVGGTSVVISRLHILRKSQTVVQIYKDLGQNNGYEISMSLEKFVPILRVGLKGNRGTARTKFYNIKLAQGSKDFKPKLSALSSVIRSGSLSALDKEQKPYVLRHSFKEKNPAAGLLVLRYNALNSVDKITVAAPNGDEQKFLRRYKGYSIGLDFETYFQDLLSLFSSKIAKTSFSPTAFSQTNPGYTFKGRAFNKIQIFESKEDRNGVHAQPYSRLTRVWNGWQVKQEKAIKILKDIKERYRFNFVPDEVLAQTKKLFLYNFSVNLYVHKEGIEALVNQKDDALKDIFRKYQNRDQTNYTGDDALVNSGIVRLLRWKKKYLKYMAKNDVDTASNYLLKMVSMIERKLSVEGYAAAFGTKANFLLLARIDGFRIGDEDGDTPIQSSTFGMLGNDNLNGPSAEVMEFFRESGEEAMTEGEFYVNWLMGRLI